MRRVAFPESVGWLGVVAIVAGSGAVALALVALVVWGAIHGVDVLDAMGAVSLAAIGFSFARCGMRFPELAPFAVLAIASLAAYVISPDDVVASIVAQAVRMAASVAMLVFIVAFDLEDRVRRPCGTDDSVAGRARRRRTGDR